LATELQQDQENWVRAKSVMEYPILVQALELFGKTGFPLDHVTLKFGHEDDIAQTIFDEARTGGYGTIVISRQGSNGMKRNGSSAEVSRISCCVTRLALRCESWNDRMTREQRPAGLARSQKKQHGRPPR
jgi:hypothetical protein